MKILNLVFVFMVLAVLDFAAALLALEKIGASSSLPAVPTAAAIHVIVAAVGCLAVMNFPGMRQRPGYRTVALFAGCLCLLTPVVGPLVAAWFVWDIYCRPATAAVSSLFVIGNPRRGQAVPALTLVSEPLSVSMGRGHVAEQRQAAPLLRRPFSPQSVALLRRLLIQPDARTQLYAQSALSSVLDSCESSLAELRRRVTEQPDDPWRQEALATALLDSVALGIYPATEAKDLVAEASALLDQALALSPQEPALIFRKATCLIESQDLDPVPELYGRLCALSGGLSLAEQMESRYFAAIGNWHRTATAVAKSMEGKPSPNVITEPVRRFWTCSATFRTLG